MKFLALFRPNKPNGNQSTMPCETIMLEEEMKIHLAGRSIAHKIQHTTYPYVLHLALRKFTGKGFQEISEIGVKMHEIRKGEFAYTT